MQGVCLFGNRESGIGNRESGSGNREGLWTYNHERPNMALGGITPAMKLAMAA